MLPAKTFSRNLDILSKPLEISITTVNKETFINDIPLKVYENNLSQIEDVKQREEIRAEIKNAIQTTQTGGGPGGFAVGFGFLTSCAAITFAVLTSVHYAFTDPVNTVFHDLGKFTEWVTTDVCAREKANKGMFSAFHFVTLEEAVAENPYCKFKGRPYDYFIDFVNRGLAYKLFTIKQIYDSIIIDAGSFFVGWVLLSKICTFTVGAVSPYLAVAGKKNSKSKKAKKVKKSRKSRK
jgi:hypothetical protein